MDSLCQKVREYNKIVIAMFGIQFVELKELKVAAGGLLPGEGPITIVSREGPTDGEENSSKKKKKGKDRKIPERGFKTSSLQDAIEAWQYKFNDAQGENSKLEKKARFQQN